MRISDWSSDVCSSDLVLVVNCARGGLVDEAALRKLLDEGHVAGAAFDVFVEEPAKANPLFGAANFVATPHLGASTNEICMASCRERVCQSALISVAADSLKKIYTETT